MTVAIAAGRLFTHTFDDESTINLPYLTAGEWADAADDFDKAAAADKISDKVRQLRAMLLAACNDSLHDHINGLTMAATMEAARAMIRQNATDEDKKKSESPSP